MSQEHKKRWIAAVIGLVLLFGTYFLFGHWGLVGISVLLSSAAYYEFLVFSGASKNLKLLSTLVGVILSAWLCLDLPGAMLAVYTAILLVLLRVLWQAHSSSADQLPGNFLHAQARIFALLYLIVLPSFVPRLHALAHGPVWLLFLLCIIWLGDTAAYYGGENHGQA